MRVRASLGVCVFPQPSDRAPTADQVADPAYPQLSDSC